MTGPGQVPDRAERERALDTGRSFLVQAPAGAGKTELLVRRYLKLLAQVNEPEDILAVTFTRKAAAEMRRRIIGALAVDPDGAGADAAGIAPQILALVSAVRARDGARGWQLSRHPARLRISTIDALNAALARNAPISAGASVLRAVSEQPDRLYRLAARAALRLLSEPGAPRTAAADLLRHLDNDPGRAEELLAQLLGRRDQWLPFVGAGADTGAARRDLESSLSRLVQRELERVEAAVPAGRQAELDEIVHAAAINAGQPLAGRAGGSVDERVLWWRFAAGVFLTGKGEWRKAFSVRDGFPPDQKDLKLHAKALAGALGDSEGLQDALAGVRQLPDPGYSAGQWRALEALLTLLPYAAAELKLVFAAEGETDYPEIAAEGRAALGDEGGPSELALRVDWRLQHLLLDEFQDTSKAQYELLRALTRGWTPGDGRTLFLVGDPMQSIYRFRQAEVRLFLDVRDHGLPGVVLEFLRLRANFRSVPALVTWANEAFSLTFPSQDDLVSSAISFAASEPARTGAPAGPGAVTVRATSWNEPGAEAEHVVRVVRDVLARWPGQSIGILVRSRTHAAHIVAALRAADIDLAATDLIALGRTALANDLLAITRALIHAGDRLAWLTVMRAPWCGLTLADLERIGAVQDGRSLYEIARDAASGAESAVSTGAGVTADGRERLSRLVAAFEAGLGRLGQVGLRDVVEGVWLELGGPALAGRELPLADLILDEIGRHDTGGDCADVLALAGALDRTRASLPCAGAPVQLMTIHKAKGLEFDTVIIPALGRSIRRESRPALLWQELAPPGAPDLLLAPVNASGADDDPLYELLWKLRARQELAEADRLVYVAVTRARERLYLFGQAQLPRGAPRTAEGLRPARGSLLDRLWPVLGPAWPGLAGADGAGPAAGVPPGPPGSPDPAFSWRQPRLRRLPSGWHRPAPPAGMRLPRVESAPARSLLIYDWASAWARHAGSVAHRWLQQIALEGVEHYTPDRILGLRPQFRALLLRQGVDMATLERALDRVVAVLEGALGDSEGQWVLSGEHREALNEYGVTVADGSRFRHLIIDRAFVGADGVRWIVDYKTSSHEGGDREAFIRSEVERYAPQLKAYRQAFACLEQRTTRTALYFPLLRLLREVGAEDHPAAG